MSKKLLLNESLEGVKSFFEKTFLKLDARKILNFGVESQTINVDIYQG
jgi:hypothetical protein